MDAAPYAVELRPPASPPPPSAAVSAPPAADLDRALFDLAACAPAFAQTPPREKAAVLRTLVDHLRAAAPELAALSCRLRGKDPDGPLAAGEWLVGPVALIAAARFLALSLDIAADVANAAGRARPPRLRLHRRPDGRVEAALGSAGALVPGATVRVLFEPGVAPEPILAERAARYAWLSSAPAGISVIVAAGGSVCAAPRAALDALFADGRVVLLALPPLPSPCADMLEPLFARAFAPLLERGWLRVVPPIADAAVADLASHPAASALPRRLELRLHGSSERWRAAGVSFADKPVFTSPGGAAPMIVMPYLYATDELRFQARCVAASVCHASTLSDDLRPFLVLPAGWRQKGLFLDAIRAALAALPAPSPGFFADAVPGLFGLASVGSDDPVEFASEAVAFCNGTLRGTLCASIVSPPLYAEQPAVASAVERAVAELRYGAVAVNTWPGVLYALPDSPWGGFHEPSRSGSAGMLARADKSIVDAPLRSACKPTFFGSVVPARGRVIGQRLVRYAAAPSMAALGSLALASLRR